MSTISTDSYYNASNAIRNLCAEHSKVFGEKVFYKVFTYYEKVLTKYFRMSSIFKNLFEANKHLRGLIVKDIENLLNKEYRGIFVTRSEGFYISVLKYGAKHEIVIYQVSNQYGKF